VVRDATPLGLLADSLSGVRVGISVSESADLNRLGLVERHLRLALGEVSRVVIRAGANLVYGGHLDPSGYTAFLESELDRYGRTDSPLRLIIGWSEHRRMTLGDLLRHRDALGLKGCIAYLDADGAEIAADAARGEDPEPVEPEIIATSLTALRRALVSATDVRVLIGGKERGFQGRMPGLMEEALLAIRSGQPLFLAGGFGGATASLAAVACGMAERWPLPDPGRATPDDRVTHALDAVREAMTSTEWSVTNNGLSTDDNLRLATSHRPSEVASLIARGLDRAYGPATRDL